jgi:hypothetical protein
MADIRQTFKVHVTEARKLSNEGSYATDCCKPQRERATDELGPHFKALYTILWPSNIHEPIELQFATVTQL